MKVDAHERDVEFVPPQRGTVVFDVQFRHVEEQRAAEIRRGLELETIER
jgi:DNA-binding GntR family transcriptional regulator